MVNACLRYNNGRYVSEIHISCLITDICISGESVFKSPTVYDQSKYNYIFRWGFVRLGIEGIDIYIHTYKYVFITLINSGFGNIR